MKQLHIRTLDHRVKSPTVTTFRGLCGSALESGTACHLTSARRHRCQASTEDVTLQPIFRFPCRTINLSDSVAFTFYRATPYASAVYALVVCVSVRLSQVGILLKRLNVEVFRLQSTLIKKYGETSVTEILSIQYQAAIGNNIHQCQHGKGAAPVNSHTVDCKDCELTIFS